MFLAPLPFPLRLAILILLGGLAGAFINWAIYSWTWFLKRPISPWMPPDPQAAPRTLLDRIPIIGWITLRRERSLHGPLFWVRPMMIEIVWAIGLPWFYHWQMTGGLTGGVVLEPATVWNPIAETWFWGHSILMGLLFIATFIDLDEKTIPDWVTLPGTLIALLFAAFLPSFRLPEQVVATLAGTKTIAWLHFASPRPLPTWHNGRWGLVLAIGFYSVFILALMPKICTLRYGWGRGLKIMIASMIRPARRTRCPIRKTGRRPFAITWVLLALWALGVGGIVAVRMNLPPVHWESLFGGLFGMAFGGGMVWMIRIVASQALDQEAMGFGDVTLMAMIGAFLGWQAALLTFVMAPFTALFIVGISLLLTRSNELAFGPYLCLGALVLLFGWATIWPRVSMQFNFLGPYLFVMLFVALILMALMLSGIQWFKQKFHSDPGETE